MYFMKKNITLLIKNKQHFRGDSFLRMKCNISWLKPAGQLRMEVCPTYGTNFKVALIPCGLVVKRTLYVPPMEAAQHFKEKKKERK